MGKFGTLFLVMVGIMALMYYGGMIEGENTLLTLILDPAGITYSNFFQNNIVTVIEGLVAMGVTLLLISSGKPELGIMGGLTIFLADLAYNFGLVFSKLNSIGMVEGATVGPYFPLAVLLFSPILILWGITCVEWWRGITT